MDVTGHDTYNYWPLPTETLFNFPYGWLVHTIDWHSFVQTTWSSWASNVRSWVNA